ncbi:hypothetical protein PHMEG_00026142 [Phytophthora megakarya]|uniref:Uncharacterized protein n=1 Tax=Phytophthora megakarya TaxID=4795 RepID=A0A225V984_9STRA|nr:hypothetical protein PHMEG_00026142 [Phytophthora megakarya]
MSLQDLALVNSQRAQQTAINAFSRFLVAEGVNMQFIAATPQGDMSGARFVKLMDRFAMHLTSAEGRGGKALACNSAMSYFRHVKKWLLDTYLNNRASIEKSFSRWPKLLNEYNMKIHAYILHNVCKSCQVTYSGRVHPCFTQLKDPDNRYSRLCTGSSSRNLRQLEGQVQGQEQDEEAWAG